MVGAFGAYYDGFVSFQGVLDLHLAEIYRKSKVVGANELIFIWKVKRKEDNKFL